MIDKWGTVAEVYRNWEWSSAYTSKMIVDCVDCDFADPFYLAVLKIYVSDHVILDPVVLVDTFCYRLSCLSAYL